MRRGYKIRNHLTGWRLLVVPLALAAVVMLANPASAHVVYARGFTYASGSDCTHQYSEISHGSYGYGYWKDVTKAFYHTDRFGDCSIPWYRPNGSLRNQIQTWYYYKSWKICDATNYFYNTSTAYSFTLARTWSDPPHCGAHYYADNAGGWDWNGDWHGRYFWSGQHWLPTTASLETGPESLRTADRSSTAPPNPRWVNPDGTVDLNKLPKRIPLGGPDGNPLRNSDGSIKTIDSSVLFAPPSSPPGTDPNANVAPPGAQVHRSVTRDADGLLVEQVDIIE